MRTTKVIPAAIESEIRTDLAIVQVIRLDWREDTALQIDPLEHFQIDLCLSARLQGMRVCYPEQWGPARFERVGELLLIPPGKPVVARCDFPQGTEHYTHSSTVIRLNPDLVYQWSEPGDWDDVRLEAGLDIDDPSIYSLMGRLTREAMAAPEASSPASSQRLIDLIAEQLGIEINRYFRGRQDLEFKGGLATWRLRRIDERTQQLGAPPSIAELAELCNISTRQLQRGFRVSRGSSIGRYVERCRIENAKRLLQQGTPIHRVAGILGYASHSSFTSAFRRATGTTPARFRQRV
ncbi:MAG: helix-turn-helix transcriptional regulator [Pseudomonadota bacterium]|nr:helix-turn-helix transcriptional regulator [Pseudomonadota bacterium]